MCLGEALTQRHRRRSGGRCPRDSMPKPTQVMRTSTTGIIVQVSRGEETDSAGSRGGEEHRRTMDLFTIAGVCLRRWYFTLPLLAVVVLFSYRAYSAVEPLYTSSRSIVVLPSLKSTPTPSEPEDETTAEVTNPYSGQGGSRFAVAVLARNLNSTAFLERLDLETEVAQSFEARSSSNQPLIQIDATGPSEEHVYALLDAVISEAAVVLDEFQADAGAPEVTRYRIAPAVPAGPVDDATPSRLRAAGAIVVLGAGLTAAVVVGADALLANRRRRNSVIPSEPGSPEADDAAPEADAAETDPDRTHAHPGVADETSPTASPARASVQDASAADAATEPASNDETATNDDPTPLTAGSQTRGADHARTTAAPLPA